MAFEYVNRQGDKYQLVRGKARGEKPNYYFTKKRSSGTPVETIPDGFEVYENPGNGQVFLRRPKASPITDEELAALREIVGQEARRCLVERDGDALVVYGPDRTEEDACELIDHISGFDPLAELLEHSGMSSALVASMKDEVAQRRRDKIDWYLGQSDYQKVLRFRLVDADQRRFIAERWHFSFDDWFSLGGGSEKLITLARRYVQHIGQESFFELM